MPIPSTADSWERSLLIPSKSTTFMTLLLREVIKREEDVDVKNLIAAFFRLSEGYAFVSSGSPSILFMIMRKGLNIHAISMQPCHSRFRELTRSHIINKIPVWTKKVTFCPYLLADAQNERYRSSNIDSNV